MADKKNLLTLSQIEAGRDVELSVLLKKVEKKQMQGGTCYKLTLEDKTGTIDGTISANNLSGTEVAELEDRVVSVEGFCGTEAGVKCLVVNKICATNKSVYDYVQGLEESAVKQCKDTIASMVEQIQDTALKSLVNCILHDTIEKLAVLPATLNGVGLYAGGALHQTALVSVFCYHICRMRNRYLNGQYQQKVSQDITIAAALLHMVGKTIVYADYPWRKAGKAILKGEAVVISELLSSYKGSLVSNRIDENLYEQVLHAVICLYAKNVTGASNEARILNYSVALYRDCDFADKEARELQNISDGAIAYSKNMGAYIMLGGD